MIKRKNGSQMYRNFIISYIIVLFIPLLIMTVLVFHSFVGILKEEIEINLTNSFRKTVEHFELQIEQLQEISLQIQMNNTFRDANIHEKPYSVINIRNELKKYSVSSFADKILIYHYDEDYILSTDTMYSLEDFVNMYVYNSNNNFDILNFMESPENEEIYFFSESRLALGFKKSLMYLNKIPVNSKQDYATVIYIISEASLSRILDPAVVTNDSYVFIKDPISNQIIFSFSEDHDLNKINEIMEQLQDADYFSSKEIKTSTNKFSVFTIKPENLGLEFIQVVPSDLLENKVNNIKMVFIIGMIAIVVISGLIIPIFIRINYNPIKKLKERIEETLSPKYDIKDNLNEIEALEYAFFHYNKENKELEETADNYSDIFKEYLLDCFIMGQAREIENILETCQRSGLTFDKKYYCVIILRVSKENYDGKTLYIEQMLNPTYEQKELKFFIKTDISLKKIIIILGSNDNSEAMSKKYSMDIINKFKNAYNEDIRIGTGDYVSDIFDIHLSYRQALMVLDYNYTVSSTTVTNPSELSQITKKEFKYPFELFSELENNIQQKDVFKIEETIKELLLFIKAENLTLYWAKNICFGIVNTIFEQMLLFDKNSSLLRKPYIEKIYGTEITSYNDIEAIMTEIIHDLINYINVGKESYDLELLNKISLYIKDNYLSPEFSLQRLADSIQMSPPYLSQYFKKNTNYTISQYVTKLRMRKAKELLLKTEASVSDIAAQVGYYSVSSFIRKFKELESITPGKYKKKHS